MTMKRNTLVIQNENTMYRILLNAPTAVLDADGATDAAVDGGFPSQLSCSRETTCPAASNEQQHEFRTEQWQYPYRKRSHKLSLQCPTGIDDEPCR